MANQKHLNILKKGVKVWNQWRELNPDLIPDLHHANLTGINLGEEILTKGNVRRINLSNADLSKANLYKADLRGANLCKADLHGANLEEAILFSANLERASLQEANLGGVVLNEANLNRADLSRADLNKADLLHADLTMTNLRGAFLSRADLKKANLSKADIKGASLRSTSLIGANLSGVDFENTILQATVFSETNLKAAKNLEKCIYLGRNIIDSTTIIESENLPLEFLQGCGLADWEIEATKLRNPDLTPTQITDIVYQIDHLRSENPIQLYSCFISYSHKDETFAQKLFKDLQSNGVRCWFAPEHVKRGEKLHEQIFEQIHLRDRLLLILSEESINSDWVEMEVREARKLEKKQNARKLFPIRLVDMKVIEAWQCFDVDTKKDLATEVREYYIPDFREPYYQKEFERLLGDLRK